MLEWTHIKCERFFKAKIEHHLVNVSFAAWRISWHTKLIHLFFHVHLFISIFRWNHSARPGPNRAERVHSNSLWNLTFPLRPCVLKLFTYIGVFHFRLGGATTAQENSILRTFGLDSTLTKKGVSWMSGSVTALWAMWITSHYMSLQVLEDRVQ